MVNVDLYSDVITDMLRRMVWYGMVNVDLYSTIITKVSNALDTLVSGEKPGFQTLSEGLVVLLCAEVVRQIRDISNTHTFKGLFPGLPG